MQCREAEGPYYMSVSMGGHARNYVLTFPHCLSAWRQYAPPGLHLGSALQVKLFSNKSGYDIVTGVPLVFLFDALAYFCHAVIFIVA